MLTTGILNTEIPDIGIKTILEFLSVSVEIYSGHSLVSRESLTKMELDSLFGKKEANCLCQKMVELHACTVFDFTLCEKG